MIIDRQNRFSSEQAITASAASTDLIDQGPGTERRIGTGEELYLVAVVDTVFTDSGSDSTVTLSLQSDSTSAFGSAATVVTMPVFAALTAAGTRRYIAIPPDTATERYIRAYYTVANGNLTTGAFTTFITNDIEAYRSYPKGYTITT